MSTRNGDEINVIERVEPNGNTDRADDAERHAPKDSNTVESNNNILNLCYFEIKEQGSCTRGEERCRFSHKIPTEITQNKKEVLDLLCMYVYLSFK